MGFAFGSALVRSFGALWHGKYESVHKRFSRWAKNGVWEKVFHEMVRDRKNQYLMIDSIIVRAHQQAATGRKKGGSDKALGALPRRSDDEDSSAGRRTGPAGGLRRHSGTGERLHAGDPAAGSAENRPCAGRQHRYNRRAHCHHGRGRCDPPKCNGSCSADTARPLQTKKSHRTLLRKAQHFRRFATRYEKNKENFQALVALACSWLHLQIYIDTP